MIESFKNLDSVSQAFLGTCFTWGVTALGAATVFIQKEFSRKLLDAMLGFAGGVMIAASFWSLLEPAIEMSSGGPLPAWVPPAIGFLLGGIFLKSLDSILPHLHMGFRDDEAEGIKTSLRRTTLLTLAITLHNIPEGLAIGVAFGAVGAGLPSATFAGAVALTLGIAIQNFPEGIAVALPLRREGLTRFKSFWYGQLSAVVEIIAGVLGALAVMRARPILPYALAFAAGAMIYVVIEEVVPESQRQGNTDVATLGGLLGFVIMMVLDVGLG